MQQRSGSPRRRGTCSFNPHRPRKAGATPAVRGWGASSKGFNPHRPRKAGATKQSYSLIRKLLCFNPHRPRKAGATLEAYTRTDVLFTVSILTGLERPVQLAPPGRIQRVRHRFNPHRPRKAGATLCDATSTTGKHRFNPHRPRKAGATVTHLAVCGCLATVSILTGLERPVQPLVRRTDWRAFAVSILTGLERPVQLRPVRPDVPLGPGFNPHRPRKAGATNYTSAVSGSPRRFNPHRPRKAGATSQPSRRLRRRCRFQSSPASKGRCNGTGTWFFENESWFQSSPASKGRCNIREGSLGARQPSGFNPHRPRKAGATQVPSIPLIEYSEFQSSPASKGRCN